MLNPFISAFHAIRRFFILLFFEFTRRIRPRRKKRDERALNNKLHNEALLEETHSEGFIENQSKLKSINYGVKSFSYSGCGVAAAYNALLFLNGMVPLLSLPELISHFESDGAALSGKFGTSPKSAFDLFKKLGFHAEISKKPGEFPGLFEVCSLFILTFLNNRKKLTHMIHTICVTKENGHFIAHNSHDRREEYLSYEELLNGIGEGNGLSEPICLVAIETTGKAC